MLTPYREHEGANDQVGKGGNHASGFHPWFIPVSRTLLVTLPVSSSQHFSTSLSMSTTEMDRESSLLRVSSFSVSVLHAKRWLVIMDRAKATNDGEMYERFRSPKIYQI